MFFKKKPLLTIVTVTYNAERLVENTIKSVVGQSFTNFEYIIVDGASTDNTINIVKKYRKHLRKLLSEPDNGIYEAMNKAVRLSRGSWIYFLNAGDEFSSNEVLAKIADKLAEEHDLVYGDRCRVTEDGEIKYEKAGKLENCYFKEVVFHQALFTRTKLLRERPYLEDYRIAADYEFMLYCHTTGKQFHYIPMSIAKFLEGGASRKLSTLTLIEAIKASLLNIPEEINIKRNFYFEKLVTQSIGYYLNKFLQVSRTKSQDFELRAEVVGKSIKISALKGTKELNGLLENLNTAFLVENIVSQSSTEELKKALTVNTAPDKKTFQLTAGVEESNSCDAPLKKAQMLKVTVVTVTFNASDMLEQTIKSVLSQTYSDLEYIVIDGNSTDGTHTILSKYQPYISKIIVEDDDGIYDAMNKAIDLSTGEYILFLNAGDIFYNAEVISNIFNDKDYLTDLIYGDRQYKRKDGTLVYQEAKDLSSVFSRMPYCHQSLFVKTSVIRRFKFNSVYQYAGDYEQCVRMYKAGCSFTKLNEPVCIFQQGGESESGVKPYIEAIKILFDNCDDKSIIKSNQYYSAFARNAERLLDI